MAELQGGTAGTLSDAVFDSFRKLVYDESGILFTATNRSILEQRIRDLLRGNKLPDAAAYFKLVASNRTELKNFLDAVTTNLTRFFRNQPHFDALEKFVIPEIIKIKKAAGNYNIKIWSAGCSTGEEPYTIAMLLCDILPSPFKFDITASDLSLKCLMTATEGFYDKSRVVGIPDHFLTKYFDHLTDGYKAKPVLKDRIRFDYHNLKNDAGFRAMDIVFCRNVLIYFDEQTQNGVINKFYDSMNPKSFLYIGHSESLFGMKTKFQFVKTEWATLYKKDE
jgi:chemotaxis protein methyltransferase CheR